MIPAEIIKKIRKIHITTLKLATNVFAGEYKSVFKGKGLEFHEVREYQVGDEIRLIDWNVTARQGTPHIKNYIEERELTVMILLDASGSNIFGSRNSLKKETAAEISSVLAASADKNNDKVGLIVFSDKVEKYIPPRKGRHHILRIIREILCYKPSGKGTNIAGCLDYFNRLSKKGAVIFLISDFFDSGFEKQLTLSTKKHDLIAIKINDPLERDIPDVGVVRLSDSETNKKRYVDTSDKQAMDIYRDSMRKWQLKLKNMFYKKNIDFIEIDTSGEYAGELVKFFEQRKNRRRRRG